MAKKVIQAQMQQRRDTAAQWAASNPVLLEGELGIVTDDPNLYKIGDGVTAWNDLKFRGFDGTLVQTTGDSENAAMSQKAVTEKLTELESELYLTVGESVQQCNGYYLYSSLLDLSKPKRIVITLSEPAVVNTQIFLSNQYSAANSKNIGLLKVGDVTFTYDTKEEDSSYRFCGAMLASEQSGSVSFQVSEKAIPSIEDTLSMLSADQNKIGLADKVLKGDYIRYSDGAVMGTGTYIWSFQYNAEGISHVKAFLYGTDNYPAAIAFFSTDSPSTDGYMASSSVALADTQNKGLWHEADVPEGCKLIVFSTRTDAVNFQPSIVFSNSDAFSVLKNGIKGLEDSAFAKVVLPIGRRGWIRHGTGELVASDATRIYEFDATNLTRVKAFLKSDVPVIDGISFYSTKEISTSSYLQSSIAWKGNYMNGYWYDVEIPTDAVIVCITSSVMDGFEPQILLVNSELDTMQDVKIVDISDNARDMAALQQIRALGDIYHYGMSGVAYRDVVNTIPSQSIYDIRFAAKAGYKCIEANLHKTSDGKYVVTHGLDGGLGHDFSDLQGNDAAGVKIGSNTLAYLRENFRYYTNKPEYAIPITTLEEFCEEARKCGLGVMMMYADAASIAIAENILGKDRLMMYNAPRSQYKGIIFEYLYYDDKASIVSRCEAVGKPYVYSMDNPSKFDDETLRDICTTLHQKGFFISSAYNGTAERRRLRGLGFDLFAIDGMAKDLTDNQAVVANKVITFNEDGSVSWENLENS